MYCFWLKVEWKDNVGHSLFMPPIHRNMTTIPADLLDVNRTHTASAKGQEGNVSSRIFCKDWVSHYTKKSHFLTAVFICWQYQMHCSQVSLSITSNTWWHLKHWWIAVCVLWECDSQQWKTTLLPAHPELSYSTTMDFTSQPCCWDPWEQVDQSFFYLFITDQKF